MANIPISSLTAFVGMLPAGTYVEVATPDISSSTGFASYRATTSQIVADSLTGYVPTSRSILTGTDSGLGGGGTLASNLNLFLDVENLPAKTTMAVADSFAINDVAGGNTGAAATFPNAMKAIAGLTHKALPAANDRMLLYSVVDSDSQYSEVSELLASAGSLPAGGTIGQPLIKVSSTNYDTEFATLPVIGGGTGQVTLTDRGVLLGQGTAAIGATAAMTDGQLLIGQTGADPDPVSITGDVTISALGITAIGANKVLDTMLRQGAALSVIGNATNALANVADISAAAHHRALRRSG